MIKAKRYRAQWRKEYSHLHPRTRRRRDPEEYANRLIRKALEGDPEAFCRILKITGELPADYKLPPD